MPRLSDLLVCRFGVHRKFRAFVWLVAAAMGAAFLAAPSAARADIVSYDDDFLYYIGSSDPLADGKFNYSIVRDNGPAFVMPPDFSVQKLASSSSGRYNPTTGLITWTDGSATYNFSASTFGDGLLYKPSVPSGRLHFTNVYASGNPIVGKGSRFTFSMSRFLIDSAFHGNGFNKVFVANHDGTQVAFCSATGNGMYQVPPDLPFSVYYVGCDTIFNSTPDSTGRTWFYRAQLSVQYSDTAVTGAIDKNTDAIKDLNKDLMNTDGSGSVGSDALSGSQSAMQEHMSFMEQVDALGDMFTSITADSDSRVTFPGISFGEIQIPPATVDIWEYMQPLETSCKTICTGVFIFAWFNGMRALYGRIFHDEKDVIVD